MLVILSGSDSNPTGTQWKSFSKVIDIYLQRMLDKHVPFLSLYFAVQKKNRFLCVYTLVMMPKKMVRKSLQRYVTLNRPGQECERLCCDNTADCVDQWAKSLFFPDAGCKVKRWKLRVSADFSALKILGDVEMETVTFDTQSSIFFFIF